MYRAPAEIKNKFDAARFQHLRNVVNGGKKEFLMMPVVLRQFLVD